VPAELRVDPGDEQRFYELADALLARLAAEIGELQPSPEALHRSGEMIGDSLLEWKWRYGDGRLGHWTAADIDEYLLGFFPGQMPSEDQLVADAPACVSEFMRFLDHRGQLDGDSAEDLAAHCEALREEFRAAAFDRRRWGISKTFAMQMQAEGMDPSDPEALQRWMADFNSRPFEERDRIIGPALVGRLGEPNLETPKGDSDRLAEGLSRLTDARLDNGMAEIEREIAAEIRHARELLHSALPGEWDRKPPEPELSQACEAIRAGLDDGGHPFDWIRRAGGVGAGQQNSDEELIVRCVAGTMSPTEETGLDPGVEAMIMSLEDADWLGAVVSAVRSGPGSPADPASLVAGIHSCKEVDVADDYDPGNDGFVEAAFEILSPAWLALQVVDAAERLTPLGAWALPRALALVWSD